MVPETVRKRTRAYLDRIHAELHRSFSEEYSSKQIAGSFALGAFITMLPTWGLGLLVFFVLVYLFDSINKIALFSSVIVFNPVVKWGVYAASITLGILLLGPVEVSGTEDVSAMTAHALIIRLLLGNLILAILATVISYVVVLRLVQRYRVRARDVVEVVLEEIESPDPE